MFKEALGYFKRITLREVDTSKFNAATAKKQQYVRGGFEEDMSFPLI